MDVISLALSKGYTEKSLSGSGILKGDPGEKGEKGDQGEPGIPGESLDYQWDGTKLGVKKESDENFEYVDLKGDQGESVDAYTKAETDAKLRTAVENNILMKCGIKDQFRSINTDYIFECEDYSDIENTLVDHTQQFINDCCLNSFALTNGLTDVRALLQNILVEMCCAINIREMGKIACSARILPAMYNRYSSNDPITQFRDFIYYIEYCYCLHGAQKRTIVEIIAGHVTRDYETGTIINITPDSSYFEMRLIGSYDGLTVNDFESETPSKYTITCDSNNPIELSNGEYLMEDFTNIGIYIADNINDIITNLCKIHQLPMDRFVKIVDKFDIAFKFLMETDYGLETTYLPLEFRRSRAVSGRTLDVTYYVDYPAEPLRSLKFNVFYDYDLDTVSADVESASRDGMEGSL